MRAYPIPYNKPKKHLGPVSQWQKLTRRYRDPSDGSVKDTYFVTGVVQERNGTPVCLIVTREIISHDEESGEIETINAKYTLVGREFEHPTTN